MWQEIVVIIIGIFVLIYIGKKIYTNFLTPASKKSCNSSCSGCALKNKNLCN